MSTDCILLREMVKNLEINFKNIRILVTFLQPVVDTCGFLDISAFSGIPEVSV